MNARSGIFLLSILLFATNLALGQNLPCEKTNISKSDQILLEQFWRDFKIVLNNKDKKGLSSLIKFPFNCDYCINDSSLNNPKPYLRISKKIFKKSQYKIFSDARLLITLNNNNLLDILDFSTSDDGKSCVISFSYISIPASKSQGGQQHFFTLKKRGGRFLITSAWSVP
ncbi:MAG: hypothetical protein U0T11_04080 [Chitinophagaceae bacterium]